MPNFGLLKIVNYCAIYYSWNLERDCYLSVVVHKLSKESCQTVTQLHRKVFMLLVALCLELFMLLIELLFNLVNISRHFSCNKLLTFL